MKILVADDSATTLSLTSSALNNLGHEVIPAKSGAEAVKSFEQNRPDLIILDVVMDDMDGFETAKKIRKISGEDWIPIIFLSASVDDLSIEKGIDAGGDDYLTKPFSEITLAAKIKAMQRIADMRQKLFDTTQKLFLLSSTDSLTGIYNRFQFDRSLKEIIKSADRYHYKVALLFIDLDNFKNINDSFGHHVGDLLLKEVAQRLRACLKVNDFIGRLGGDEFAVILNAVEDPEDPGHIAKNILDVLSKDYHLEDQLVRIGASIGIAFYPDLASSEKELMLNADVAMYHAKANGRNNFQYFTKELNRKYRQQITLEHELKFALEKNEFHLSFQPIYELKNNELAGLETLLVWNHPKFGVVPPNLFIPIAEETGLMVDLGNWILRTACEECAKWKLPKNKKFKFSINLSSRQLLCDQFLKTLNDILRKSNIPPNLLEFELSETILMTFLDEGFLKTIKKLRELGITIAIDDFGTGYSSLLRLKNLPISTLKIEKAFIHEAVSNSNSSIIVNCLIALGKNLNMNVIAEGVETREQLQFLIKNHCPQGQGFYLRKPMNFEETSKFFEEIKFIPTTT